MLCATKRKAEAVCEGVVYALSYFTTNTNIVVTNERSSSVRARTLGGFWHSGEAYNRGNITDSRKEPSSFKSDQVVEEVHNVVASCRAVLVHPRSAR